ncbi:MAG: PrsW family intramembrane metalloprotease, partial [Leptolyngbyaceae cyanobacterium]
PVTLLRGNASFESEFIQTAFGAPLTEELHKALAVAILYATQRREFDGRVDCLVYGALACFGFAYEDKILYLMVITEWVVLGTLFVLRTIVFGGLHGFWTALTGIGFGLARYRHSRVAKVMLMTSGLLLSMIGHFIHNAATTLVEVTDGASFLLALLNYGALLGVMLLLWLIAPWVDRARLRQYLRDEVPAVLSASLYQALCSRRSHQQLKALGWSRAQQKQLRQVAAELAQKKLQLLKMGDEQGNQAEIAQLRTILVTLKTGTPS